MEEKKAGGKIVGGVSATRFLSFAFRCRRRHIGFANPAATSDLRKD